ncbi:TIM44-like domain-containing protein [Sabulicella glaciei]|uniref:TIM44-like domain-containing protein n=1 Tax=Sabulicella glaciei TaxID=2984948 RepID=A0ABT3NQB6_9PROT|nr:TIM44-like domain-containing protein [Roseococcus sp. MDT2-1-1]MCW8084351.1 TIM44-like domain-containing protein [Roseococcus sp. MDT2-1-1]
MRRPSHLLAIAAAALLALAPALADARPGGGFSSGSRGARTYAPPPSTSTAPAPSRQMDRTMTQPTRPGSPAAAPGAARPQTAQPGGMFRNPFMAGLIGGGLLGLMMGGGFLAGGFAGMLGVLLQVILIGGLIMLAVSLLRRRAQPAPAGMAREAHGAGGRPGLLPGLAGGGAAASAPVSIGSADYQSFETLLKQVNEAWSREDLGTLSRIATPEMVGFFRDDFAALRTRGWKNETRDVRLEQGDLAEAWSEGARDYATVAMRFSAVDVTREVATGRITEGDPETRTMAIEYWTFVRSQGSPWQLSAIQQAGA